MTKKIFFIHTVNGLVDMFTSLCQEMIPKAGICHISDESLIQGVLAADGLTPAIYRRVCQHVVAADLENADVIQLTCSSISPCADIAKYMVSVPVLKIDEPMVDYAVMNYLRIGLIATAPTTLKPSSDLVHDKAKQNKRPVELKSILCEGAYDAFLSGQLEKHDQIVRDMLLDLVKEVDILLLAQASMTRIVDILDQSQKTIPILSSPRLAIERIAGLL